MKSWVYEPFMSNYEIVLLHNALRRHQDNFFYNPIALAKREEAGMKYRFLCIAVPKTYPGPPSHFADIEIYKPMKGMPYCTSLYRKDFDSMFPQRFPVDEPLTANKKPSQ